MGKIGGFKEMLVEALCATAIGMAMPLALSKMYMYYFWTVFLAVLVVTFCKNSLEFARAWSGWGSLFIPRGLCSLPVQENPKASEVNVRDARTTGNSTSHLLGLPRQTGSRTRVRGKSSAQACPALARPLQASLGCAFGRLGGPYPYMRTRRRAKLTRCDAFWWPETSPAEPGE